MILQSDLQLFPATEADRLVAILLTAAGWLHARQLAARLGLEDTESSRRHVRALAEQRGGDIITGQKGYCHIDFATSDEVRHFANWMRSQGDKMQTRALAALERKGLGQSGSDPP